MVPPCANGVVARVGNLIESRQMGTKSHGMRTKHKPYRFLAPMSTIQKRMRITQRFACPYEIPTRKRCCRLFRCDCLEKVAGRMSVVMGIVIV